MDGAHYCLLSGVPLQSDIRPNVQGTMQALELNATLLHPADFQVIGFSSPALESKF